MRYLVFAPLALVAVLPATLGLTTAPDKAMPPAPKSLHVAAVQMRLTCNS